MDIEEAFESADRAIALLDKIQERTDHDLAEARRAGPVDPETERIIRLTALVGYYGA